MGPRRCASHGAASRSTPLVAIAARKVPDARRSTLTRAQRMGRTRSGNASRVLPSRSEGAGLPLALMARPLDGSSAVRELRESEALIGCASEVRCERSPGSARRDPRRACFHSQQDGVSARPSALTSSRRPQDDVEIVRASRGRSGFCCSARQERRIERDGLHGVDGLDRQPARPRAELSLS